MSENHLNNWQSIQRQKRQLFEKHIEKLSEEEFEILGEVLRLEADHRHLNNPHLNKKIQQIVEGIIK